MQANNTDGWVGLGLDPAGSRPTGPDADPVGVGMSDSNRMEAQTRSLQAFGEVCELFVKNMEITELW